MFKFFTILTIVMAVAVACSVFYEMYKAIKEELNDK